MRDEERRPAEEAEELRGDVEGHRSRPREDMSGEDDVEGHRSRPREDMSGEDDVEGHRSRPR